MTAAVVEVTVGDDALEVRLTGLDSAVALRRHLRVAVADIVDARVVSRAEARAGLGWRVGGGYWPGHMATGWFTVPGRKGLRQWWSVYRDARLLVVDTSLERPSRVVLQAPDVDGLDAQLHARL